MNPTKPWLHGRQQAGQHQSGQAAKCHRQPCMATNPLQARLGLQPGMSTVPPQLAGRDSGRRCQGLISPKLESALQFIPVACGAWSGLDGLAAWGRKGDPVHQAAFLGRMV